MKATGIVRKIDDLGRIVIPKEIRRSVGIKERDALELYTTEEGICLIPYFGEVSLRNRIERIVNDCNFSEEDNEKYRKAISELKKIVDELK